MFSGRIDRRSIAAQLAFYFTLTAALLLTASLGLFYWLVVRHAFAEDRAVLADKITGLSADLQDTGSIAGLTAELKRQSRDLEEEETYRVRLLDEDGKTLTESPGMHLLLPPRVFPVRGRDALNYRDRGKLFSLATAQVQVGASSYTMQVAQDRTPDEHFRKEFGALLAIVLVAGIGAAAFISRQVTRRGLRSLGEMVRVVERTDPAHLSERVVAERWPPELQPLAFAFDDMLERLDESFRRLSQFSADLAHELRTPVANMLGEAQVALTRERAPERYREVIESTAVECERLSGIVDSLLFLARAEGADRRIQAQRLEASAALAKMAEYYQPIADEQAVTIATEGKGEMLADPMLFERALSNLIENAIRFTPQGGAITLAAVAHIDGMEISVRDNGRGIPPEEIPRVFDRFYRVDSARSAQGAGLGLALVRTIAELHGGTADIRSRIGEGTTATLFLPNPGGNGK